MIDPIQITQLDVMFEHWLATYQDDIKIIPHAVILVDSSLPGHLELLSEMDLLLDKYQVEATVQSIRSGEINLHSVNVILCITRANSMIDILAKLQIYNTTKSDLGQVWEIVEH